MTTRGNRPARICVVGSLNTDLVIRAPALPVPGQTILGGPFATFPGGKGANQAVAAARAGAQVALVGCLGTDQEGAALRAGLAAEGISTAHLIERAGVASGVAVIAVASDGQNTIIVAPGANAALTPHDIQAAAPAIEHAAVLLVQLETPLAAVAEAMRLARAAGTRVLLNPAPMHPDLADLLPLADVLLPNESEAALLSGQPVRTWEEATQAARQIQQRGPASIVLTLGSRGALLLDNTGTVHQQPAYPVRAVDTTAAGDAFVGAFAVALAEGLPQAQAVAYGAAAGALAVTQAGAQPSLPLRPAIEQQMHASSG